MGARDPHANAQRFSADDPSIDNATPDRTLTRVALLGCGTIGAEVAHQLLLSGTRLGVMLTSVLVRDTSKQRGLPAKLFTSNIDEVLATRPDIVIELVGGVQAPLEYAFRVLASGASLVTANKALLAAHGVQLDLLARRYGEIVAAEASVCAGVPVLAALRQLAGDRVLSLRGVVNGSCNFILSRLAAGDLFNDALACATRKGLVEPDPTADISGRDSAEKLCLLARACGYRGITTADIHTTGIEAITPEDAREAKRQGYAIKLIAQLDVSHSDDENEGVTRKPSLRVSPTLVPSRHALAQLQDEDNGLLVRTELAGELYFKGKGAGPGPTASAVLGDVLLVARHKRTQQHSRSSNESATASSSDYEHADIAAVCPLFCGLLGRPAVLAGPRSVNDESISNWTDESGIPEACCPEQLPHPIAIPDDRRPRSVRETTNRATPVARRYCLRVSLSRPVQPEQLTLACDSTGLAVREISVSRERAILWIGTAEEAAAERLRVLVASTCGSDTLLMQIIED